MPDFRVLDPRTGPIGSGLRFPAISKYECVRSSHTEPIQALYHVPSQICLMCFPLNPGGEASAPKAPVHRHSEPEGPHKIGIWKSSTSIKHQNGV